MTLKLLIAIAEQAIKDEEFRKKLLMIIFFPILLIVFLMTSLSTFMYSSDEELQSMFLYDDELVFEDFRNEFGFYFTGGSDFAMSEYENTDALDPEQFKKLLAEASKYIGYPYKWQGSTPSTSFDCSGFVCWSYTKSNTYNLPRTTAQGIYNQCVRIPSSEAKAGDLIFFHSTYNTTNTVTHIGIYLGNDKMLHAGDPIGIASTNTTYWKNHFYGYGRLATNTEKKEGLTAGQDAYN